MWGSDYVQLPARRLAFSLGAEVQHRVLGGAEGHGSPSFEPAFQSSAESF